MTLFEYLAIAFSLVLSFAAMRLIAGLSYAAQPGRRYWVHLAFVLGHLCLTILVFWNLWNLRDVSWNLPRFVLALAYPGLVYFTACALIPEQASAVDSWRSYYYSARPRFFIGMAAIVVVVALAGTAVLEPPWLHPVRIPQSLAMGIALLGAFSPSPRVHACLAALVLLMSVVVLPVIFIQPGSVGQ